MSIFHNMPGLSELNAQWLPKLDQACGVKIIEVGEQSLTAEFSVEPGITQPHGIMHGGFSCVIGESLGSIAGNMVLQNPKQRVVGQGLQALHLRPAAAGSLLIATAEALHLGRRSQIWETHIREQKSQRLIARITLTLAVIEEPS